MDSEHQYYVILTHTIPVTTYTLIGEHKLRPVKTLRKMFEGYGHIIPHHLPAVMTLDHLSTASDTIWKQLVMFHSFLCDDSETYDYSERSWKKDYGESELHFVHNQDYFFETIDLGNKQLKRKLKRKRVNAIDFDDFHIKVYPTTKETLEEEPVSAENEALTLTEALSVAKEVTPEYEVSVRYNKAFQVFCNLRSIDKKLYNQICLYVFAGNLREFSEVYHNDNAPIAFYISILESQAGDPPTCRELLHCNRCGRDILNHGTPIEEHFIGKYGTSFKELRKIRHKFFHQGEYSSGREELWNIYDQRDDARHLIDHPELIQELDKKEEDLDYFGNEVERLQKITRRTLIESFMRHYGNRIPRP
ncbi:hypothetical protein DA01_03030 [Dehalococcoides mccartyi]|uniref:Uncharacterized protein n=1 Tax=Dehalococcoides mccartyi TaxID=61435 RepID=A0A0V8M3Z1_9CHLR|nr:hypothetical protein [Dehalococcoides mccartyi]KSV18491.1 hypothetical protein DA01_03030 [Dehalococcoides mccartyi]